MEGSWLRRAHGSIAAVGLRRLNDLIAALAQADDLRATQRNPLPAIEAVDECGALFREEGLRDSIGLVDEGRFDLTKSGRNLSKLARE